MDFINSNLSQIPFKTLREHEQEPSDEHKLHAMKEILYTDPGLFLSKWGKYLPNEQLSRFEVLRGGLPIVLCIVMSDLVIEADCKF